MVIPNAAVVQSHYLSKLIYPLIPGMKLLIWEVIFFPISLHKDQQKHFAFRQHDQQHTFTVLSQGI